MNNIAILPYIGMHALQIQNVKRNVYKKVDIQELNVVGNNDVVTPIEPDSESGSNIDNLPETNIDNLPESNNID